MKFKLRQQPHFGAVLACWRPERVEANRSRSCRQSLISSLRFQSALRFECMRIVRGLRRKIGNANFIDIRGGYSVCIGASTQACGGADLVPCNSAAVQ
jgi:hypothetical protein